MSTHMKKGNSVTSNSLCSANLAVVYHVNINKGSVVSFFSMCALLVLVFRGRTIRTELLVSNSCLNAL
jgi:hypothetical protein